MTAEARPVLVLGATGGIGTRVVERLVETGRKVIVAGRDEARTNELAERHAMPALIGDATDFDAVGRIVADAGPIVGAVNCVGSMLLKAAHQTSREAFDDTFQRNVVSAFALVRAAAPAMPKARGSIVLVSSCAAQVGLSNHEAIAAAKGAVEGLTRSAAATYASRGVRVNAVAPGLTRTPLSRAICDNELALKASVAMHPLGRIGTPDDVAAAIVWLLSDETEWMTGQVLGVDGGLVGARPRMRVS